MKSYTCRVRTTLSNEYFIIFEYECNRINKYEIYQTTNNFIPPNGSPSFVIANNPKEALQKQVLRSLHRADFSIEILSSRNRKNYYMERLNNYLLQEYVDKSFFEEIWGFDENTIVFFESLKKTINGKEKYSRWESENFLKARRLIPFRLAAVELGVKELCLDGILDYLRSSWFFDCRLALSSKLIRIDSLRRIPSIVFPDDSFDSRNAFLEKFFDLLKGANVLCIPDYCFIEQNLTRKKIIVDYLDIVINRPVSSKYCIPIDNGKPPYMHPDMISSYSNWICSKGQNLKLWNLINKTAIETTQKMG